MSTVVIFLGGEQGSGKSSAAKFIEESVNHSMGNFIITLKFADVIYRLHDQIEAQFSKILGREPLVKNGPLLQILGTEIGRNLYHPDIWVKCVEEHIKSLHLANTRDGMIVIVEDVRFRNEFDLSVRLKAEFFDTISIYFDAPEDVRALRTKGFRSNTGHQSESELASFKDLFDYKISTEGSIFEKNRQLSQILKDRGLLPDPQERLEESISIFNELIAEWEDNTGYGANFEWYYTKEGKKRLRMKDLAPIDTLPEDKVVVRLREVEKVMESLDGPSRI